LALAVENAVRNVSLCLLFVVSPFTLRGDEPIPRGCGRAFDGQGGIGGFPVLQDPFVCRDSIALDEIVQDTLRSHGCSMGGLIGRCAFGAKARVCVGSNGPHAI
jgi:hypothetical protein